MKKHPLILNNRLDDEVERLPNRVAVGVAGMHRQQTLRPAFTLVELLVVIAIIGILAAIAIPQFAAYRSRGFDARAKSDLRNVATAEEAYFPDSEVYQTCSQATCPGLLPGP